MTNLNLDEEKNELLGELDHLNSLVGLAKSLMKRRKDVKLFTAIQNDLFVLQAGVVCPNSTPALQKERVFDLQKETYGIESTLEPLDHFLIPEGTTGSCVLHCVRTQARAVERKTVGYLDNPTIVAFYMDQLACLMFALARDMNRRSGIHERQPTYVTRKRRRSNNPA